MEISNAKVAKLLRGVAAAYTIRKIGSVFQIRAYENAAGTIEQLTVEIHDLWLEGKLKDVPNIGEKLQGYLEELFKTGKVKHFEDVQRGIRPVVFDLLDISGIGPKTAQKIAELGVLDISDLKKKIKSGELISKGFSAKLAERLLEGMQKTVQKNKRMLLSYAWVQADKILQYLLKSRYVFKAHFLGSLRRMVPTVGDLDFAVSSHEGKKVVEYFCKMPGVLRVIDKGETKATVILFSGVQADLLVVAPQSYGALLQHFTGSKSHNIKLRTVALHKKLSLSEYGVKKQGKLIPTETEEEFYKLLGMQVPPPELREDTGEIEAALAQKLPRLVDLSDIKGDLHTHSSFPIENPSHGPGADSIEDIVKKAVSLNYEFIGIADHSPSPVTAKRDQIIVWVKKRTKFIQSLQVQKQPVKKNTKSIHILNGLEIDILPDGSLSMPDEVLAMLDYCIAGIHTMHRDTKEKITKRLLSAINNPYVDIISHPTNRLLNERDSSEADWEEIFKAAAQNKKLLEINGYPNRLDLRDDLVRRALDFGVKFVINTDAHEVSQMDSMRFGVSVARRGWATKESIVNTWDWKRLTEWFKIK